MAFREAAHPSSKEYAHQVVTNASALAGAVAGEGSRLVSGGTDNHMMAEIASFIAPALEGRESAPALAAIRSEVAALCATFPAYPDGV